MFNVTVPVGCAVQGYLFGILSAFLSALAAVYTEWVMKRNNDSLYGQNMQLYAWGILFNGIGLTIADSRKDYQVRAAATSRM